MRAFNKPSKLLPLATTPGRSLAPNALRTRHYASATSKQETEQPILERQILRPYRTETCPVVADDEVARHKAPYDPSKTTAESAVQALREEFMLEGAASDLLLYSPANPQVSRVWYPTVGGPTNGTREGSVRGWTHKNKKVLLRTEPYTFRKYGNVFSDKKREKKA